MAFKSATCVGKASGRPLTEYDTEAEARQAAQHARAAYGRRLVPYRCDTCGLWHLSPESRQTPSAPCPACTGLDGRPKEAYLTEKDARRRAALLAGEQGADLRVYPCPRGHGWHLTSGSGR